MKLSIIIIHWNTPEQLKVQSSKFEDRKNIEVVVVDNNSDTKLVTSTSKVKLIQNKSNVGFAKACNQGAKIAKGEWLLFLNPDTHITSSDILKFVHDAEAQHLDAACLNPSSSNYLKPLPSPFSLLVEFSPLHRVIPLRIFKQKTLFGGGSLIKRSVLKKLGGWDEKFFLWFEDSDLTRRLLDNGYKIGWVNVPHSHAGGSSFKRLVEDKRKKIFFSSMNKYASKHFGFFGQLVVKFIIFLNK